MKRIFSMISCIAIIFSVCGLNACATNTTAPSSAIHEKCSRTSGCLNYNVVDPVSGSMGAAALTANGGAPLASSNASR